MTELTARTNSVREGLLRVALLADRLSDDVRVPGRSNTVPLVAYSNRPFDSRTASVGVLQGERLTEPEIVALRPLGAWIVEASVPLKRKHPARADAWYARSWGSSRRWNSELADILLLSWYECYFWKKKYS